MAFWKVHIENKSLKKLETSEQVKLLRSFLEAGFTSSCLAHIHFSDQFKLSEAWEPESYGHNYHIWLGEYFTLSTELQLGFYLTITITARISGT